MLEMEDDCILRLADAVGATVESSSAPESKRRWPRTVCPAHGTRLDE